MSGIRDSILPPLEWLSEQDPPAPAAVSDWLMELGSMTRRFERHCAQVRVEPQRECFVTREALGDGRITCPTARATGCAKWCCWATTSPGCWGAR